MILWNRMNPIDQANFNSYYKKKKLISKAWKNEFISADFEFGFLRYRR